MRMEGEDGGRGGRERERGGRGDYLLSICDATCSLLAVTTGKLVTDLRDSDRADPYLTKLVTVLI